VNLAMTFAWREFRESRSILLVCAVLVPVACVGLAFALPREMFANGDFVSRFSAACVILPALVLGSELFMSELRGQRLAVIGRLPFGIGRAFWVKLGFLVAVCLGLGALGLAVSVFACAVVDGIVFTGFWSPLLFAATAIVALGLGAWTMAVAAWVPRGSFAIVGTLLLLGTVSLPYTLAWYNNPWVRPSLTEVVVLGFVLFPVLGLIVAWLSVLAYARGHGAGRALLLGGIVALFGFSPGWAWVHGNVQEWDRARPFEKDFFISNALIGTGEHYAYVSAYRARDGGRVGRWYALIVDLESGEWKQVGGADTCFSPISALGRRRYSSLECCMPHELLLQGRYDGKRRAEIIDGRTTKIIGTTADRSVPIGRLDAIRRALADRSALRFADGRPAWVLDDIESLTADGELRAYPLGTKDVPYRNLGHGLEIRRGKDKLYFDLARWQLFEGPGRKFRCVILPEFWLVQERRSGFRYLRGPWQLYDPETRNMARCTTLDEKDSVLAVLDDGRVVVQPVGVRFGGPAIVDLATGKRVSIDCSAMGDSVAVGVGLDVFRLQGPGSKPWLPCASGAQRWLARLDVAAAQLSAIPWPESARVVSIADDRVILADEHTLYVGYLDGREPKLLFPLREKGAKQ